jgi:hypothetical protein
MHWGESSHVQRRGRTVKSLRVSDFCREVAGALGSAGAGYLVWALSPRVTGEPLPWDASWPYYSLWLIGCGCALSLVTRRYAPVVLAVWIGQVTALVVLPLDTSANMWGEGAWWVLGVLSTAIGSLLALIGLWIGRSVRDRLRASGAL